MGSVQTDHKMTTQLEKENSTESGAPGASTPTIFIDGEAGTTGLQIAERLSRMDGANVISIAPDLRKDNDARQDKMLKADLVVLCLPDQAAREAVQLAGALGANAPRILDASTAHRVSEGWVYGFAELCAGQAEAIAQAQLVANPGCYPTGAVALLRPLVDAKLIANDFPATINAVSGYSGGGRKMIEDYEAGIAPPFEIYGLGLQHKHLPEIEHYSGLTRPPIFVPSVGNFRQGMVVSIPLHLDALPAKPSPADLEQVLKKHYASSEVVQVLSASDRKKLSERLIANVADTDLLELGVFADEAGDRAVLIARLDNLGKGAAGAAVQNIKLMLGL